MATPLRKSVRFPGSRGITLAGLIELPSETPLAYGVWAPCFSCTKDLKSAKWICEALAKRGIAMLRFDFMGLGESHGHFSEATLSSFQEDLRGAIHFLSTHYEAPLVLMGHSLGGYLSLIVAQYFQTLKAVVTLATPASLQRLCDILTQQSPAIATQGSGWINLGGPDVLVGRTMVEDFAKQNLEAELRFFHQAHLILHAHEDDIVPFSDAQALEKLTSPHSELHALPESSHLLLDRKQAQQAAQIIGDWLLEKIL